MVIPRSSGRVLLMTKRFYPTGIFRLPTGGMQQGESPETTFRREIKEETGLDLEIDRYLGKIDYILIYQDERLNFTSHVFLTKPSDSEISPEDDSEEIIEFQEVSISGLISTAKALESLEQTAPEWAGWGRFRAAVHRFVNAKILELYKDPGS